MILPVWHDLTHAEIAKNSPILADRLGVSTSNGIELVANTIVAVINPLPVNTRDINTSKRTDGTCAVYALSGNDQGKIYSLNHERNIVGRSSLADVRLNEAAASRSHFAIVWVPGFSSYSLQEWGHPNRISLNGRYVPHQQDISLKDGDLIQLGETTLRFEILSNQTFF